MPSQLRVNTPTCTTKKRERYYCIIGPQLLCCVKKLYHYVVELSCVEPFYSNCVCSKLQCRAFRDIFPTLDNGSVTDSPICNLLCKEKYEAPYRADNDFQLHLVTSYLQFIMLCNLQHCFALQVARTTEIAGRSHRVRST